MTTRPVRFGGTAQLGTSAGAVDTVPSNTTARIYRRLTFANTSGSTRIVTVWLVPSGAAAATENKIVPGKALLPGETWSCPDIEGQVLSAGGTVQAAADAAGAISVVGSATEVV